MQSYTMMKSRIDDTAGCYDANIPHLMAVACMSGMENITIFLKKWKILDIFNIFDLYPIFLIVMFKNKNLY